MLEDQFSGLEVVILTEQVTIIEKRKIRTWKKKMHVLLCEWEKLIKWQNRKQRERERHISLSYRETKETNEREGATQIIERASKLYCISIFLTIENFNFILKDL